VKEEYNRYREEVKNATKSDLTEGLSQPTRQVAPSLDHTAITEHWSTADNDIWRRKKETFSEVVKNQVSNERYRITLKPKE